MPDIVGSIVGLREVSDNAYDAVFLSDNIKHLYTNEVPMALHSFKRVLRKNGHAVILCPDLENVCAYVSAGRLTEPLYISPAGPVSPLDVLYGLRDSVNADSHYMAHRCGFLAASLREMLHNAGFEMVWTKRDLPRFPLCAVALGVMFQ